MLSEFAVASSPSHSLSSNAINPPIMSVHSSSVAPSYQHQHSHQSLAIHPEEDRAPKKPKADNGRSRITEVLLLSQQRFVTCYTVGPES